MTQRFLGDTALLTGRSLRHIARSPDTIITTAVMPIVKRDEFGGGEAGAGEFGDAGAGEFVAPGAGEVGDPGAGESGDAR